jgi:hypothetical protein
MGNREMKDMKKLLLATAALCVFSTGVNACGGVPRFCYSRIYDSTHLAKHPDQAVSAMRIALSDSDIAEGLSDFDLSVQFRGDHDKWQWATTGTCYRFGPGMTCVEILDGCDTSESNHFYVTQNPNMLYLYPSKINLHRGDLTEISANKEERIASNERILNEGKDDKIFRLDKTACWKKEK